MPVSSVSAGSSRTAARRGCGAQGVGLERRASSQGQRRFSGDTAGTPRALRESLRHRERHAEDGGAEGSVRQRRRRARCGGAPVPAEDLHRVQALSRRQDRRRHARCARFRAPSRRRAQCRGRAECPVPPQRPLEGVSAIAASLSHRSRGVRTTRHGCLTEDLVSPICQRAVSRPPLHERHPRRADATAADKPRSGFSASRCTSR